MLQQTITPSNCVYSSSTGELLDNKGCLRLKLMVSASKKFATRSVQIYQSAPIFTWKSSCLESFFKNKKNWLPAPCAKFHQALTG